jgi:hypothetical protein
MNFEWRIQQLAGGASLYINEIDYRHAVLKFNMNSGRVQPLWIIPYEEVWEFSVPSAIQFNNPGNFSQALLAVLLAKNAKNKRAFWAMEQINGKHVLSAMLNFPSDNLTPAEFGRICRALVFEVEQLELAFLQ